MRLADRIASDRRYAIASVVVILLVAAFVRFYHIQWSFSNNGIDEGVMLERSLMVSHGYSLYTELPCDQAPLAFYMGALFDGDPVMLRSLSAALSIIAIAACMEAARRIKGNVAMVATGVLMTVDFAFLRESRLFSLDGMSSYFLAFSVLLFVLYIQKRSRLALACSGFMVGLSTASKLLGVLGLLAMMVFMLLEMRRAKSPKAATAVNLVLVMVTAAIPMTAFLLALGPSDMLQGMLFDQGHRSFDAYLKLSIPLYLGLNLAYLLPFVRARSVWAAGPEHRFLLTASVVILAFMIIQPLVFFHHMVLLSPTLAVLAGAVIQSEIRLKKAPVENEENKSSRKLGLSSAVAVQAILLAGLMVSSGLAAYGLVMQGETWQNTYAERMKEITGPNDWIISGDPLVAAFAGLEVPPDMVNVAYRIYPDFTIEDIREAVVAYNVSVIIVNYRLGEFDDLLSAIGPLGYSVVSEAWIEGGSLSVLDMPSDPYGETWFLIRSDLVGSLTLEESG